MTGRATFTGAVGYSVTTSRAHPTTQVQVFAMRLTRTKIENII
jgi:hypothetical protein